MRILVCGDRNWTDEDMIIEELLKLTPKGLMPTVIIHGAAEGADTLAAIVAKDLGFLIHDYPAEWHKYGRSAGPVRNRQMLEYGRPDLVLAFHDDIRNSEGTKDMVNQAKKAGVPVKLISHA